MDQINLKDAAGELTSPPSPKRPRTGTTMTISHNRTNRFDFPELLTFEKNSSTLSSPMQKSSDLMCTTECRDNGNEKPHEHQDTNLILTAVTPSPTSHTGNAYRGSTQVCSIAAERNFLHLVKDEQPLLIGCDKLSSNPLDDAGGALAESHTPKDASADTSSHLDCKGLGESLEDKPPGGCNLPFGNVIDVKQVQNGVNQIRVFTCSSSDEEVRRWSDCTQDDVQHNAGVCDVQSLSAEVEESNQRTDGHGFSKNRLFMKEKEEFNNPTPYSDYTDMKSFYSNPEYHPSRNLVGGFKNGGKILELQIHENEKVALCDEEIKGQVNENGPSENSIPSAHECAEEPIVSYDGVLARNIANENGRVEADDFWGVTATSKMIVKTQNETADHITETPMPARISQESAEGDNDAGPFHVIDPAIWRETDREAEEKHCNSESTAGAELSPSVKFCKREMLLPLCTGVMLSQEISAPAQTLQFNHKSGTKQCKDEKEDLCQSYTEPQACPITTNETHNMTDNEGSCLWKSGSSSCPKLTPAVDGRQQSHDTVGHQLKEEDPAGCFPVSSDPLKTQEVKYSKTEIIREEITCFEEEIRSSEHSKSENSVDFEERLLGRQNEKYKEDKTEILSGDCRNCWVEGETSEYDNRSTDYHEELGKNGECLSDHAHSALIPIMGKTTEDKEMEEEESDVHGKFSYTLEDGHQQQSHQKSEMTEASPDDCVSEWTEGSVSNCGNKLTPVSQHEQGNKLSFFFDHQVKAETFLIDNKDDLLASTVSVRHDAVVPGQHELIHSQSADNNCADLNCCDIFSPVPSAFTVCIRRPEGFDTFKKFQLMLDDDDDDDDAGLSPLLTSLPRQLLKTPQRQLCHSMPEAESSKHKEAPEEEREGDGGERVEIFECHTENMANGFLSSDYSCNKLPNFISAADVTALGWPEKQPNSESTCTFTECFHNDTNQQSVSSTVSSKSNSPVQSEINHSPKFEMKKQFDMVVKELNLYFEISMSDLLSDSTASSPEQRSDVAEALDDDISHCKEELSSPDIQHHRDTSIDTNEDHSLDISGGDLVAPCTSGRGDSEQEVPFGSCLQQEAIMHTAETDREPQETEQKRETWSPSFVCRPFFEQLSHTEQPRRLGPLRTCTRPIRVGLSKRAKTKHLHHPTGYK